MANSLAVEGQKRNVLVNAIAPLAGSRLTETILPPEMVAALKPEYVAPLVAFLCHHSNTATGQVFEVGAGWAARVRWQRARGAFLPLGAGVTPEAIAGQWADVENFDDPTYPETPMDSFAPVVENLKTAAAAQPPSAASKATAEPAAAPARPAATGGPLDAVGFEFAPTTTSYDEGDLSLYALSIGAATDPLDASELQFVYELSRDGFKALPTYAVTFPFSLLWQITGVPGLRFNPALLLHGEQYLELRRPLPVKATVTNTARIANIYDKGSGALGLLDVDTADEQGQVIARNQVSLFIRGIGGFGGERGPSSAGVALPDRAPDAVHREKTNENQALLYRLSSGDRNPLHSDPAFAAMGGFDRPILHGLCTYGFTGRALLHTVCGGDPSRFTSMEGRFSSPVLPGEDLTVSIWVTGDGEALFRTAGDDGRTVIDSGRVTFG